MTDRELHEEIMAELACEPGLDAERLGVAVEHGVVTLTGFVDSYPQKLAAEQAARRVYSAKAVVDEIETHLSGESEGSDTELATRAVRAVEADTLLPEDSVRITVRHGHLLLEGRVDWPYQKQEIESRLHRLPGVRGIRNVIRVVEPTSAVALDCEARR